MKMTELLPLFYAGKFYQEIMFSWRKFVSFIEEPFLTGFRYPMEKTDYITKHLFLCILLGKYGGAPVNSRNSNYCVATVLTFI